MMIFKPRLRTASFSLLRHSSLPSGRSRDGDFDARSAAVDDAFGKRSAIHDAAENIHEDRFDFGIGEDDLEPFGDFLFRSAAADIQENSRAAAVVLDDVHRRHGKASAVDHAADIAIQGNVGQIIFFGRRFIFQQLRRIVKLGLFLAGGRARCRRCSVWHPGR